MRRGAGFASTLFLCVFIGLLATGGEQVAHEAIVISNDYEFTVENGVCSGQGTYEDPYVIEDWVIDAGLDNYGIKIHGTSRYFIIRNVEVSGAAKAGIYLSYVQNGTIEDCAFIANWAGVTINFSSFNKILASTFSDHVDAIRTYFSHTNQIMDCTFEDNDTAIWLDASNENRLTGNLIQDSHMGLYLNLGSKGNTILDNAFVGNLHSARSDDPNVWDDGTRGNYWHGFEALDTDLDGIWDAPYVISSDGDQDNCPLVGHARVEAPPAATCNP